MRHFSILGKSFYLWKCKTRVRRHVKIYCLYFLMHTKNKVDHVRGSYQWCRHVIACLYSVLWTVYWALSRWWRICIHYDISLIVKAIPRTSLRKNWQKLEVNVPSAVVSKTTHCNATALKGFPRIPHGSQSSVPSGNPVECKRWIKQNIFPRAHVSL